MKILDYRTGPADVAALLLRIIIGSFFIYYGYMKLTMYDALLKGFPDPLGLGVPLTVNLVIFAEFFCGLLLLLGLFTRLAVFPMFINMTVVYFNVHVNDPFNEKQIALLYWLLLIVILILGSGKFSVDALIFRKRN